MMDQTAMRRARYAMLSAVLLTAATAACVIFITLASRHHTRFDVTATREHALSERTHEILKTIEGTHRIVVSVDPSQTIWGIPV